jgi:hypothetical protein
LGNIDPNNAVVWGSSARGTDVDTIVKELVLISVVAVLGLGLAWRFEADYFAMFFGASAAIAMVEAVRRSL